jgi:hypothetical protein
MEEREEPLPPTDDVVVDPAGDALSESEEEEGSEGDEGFAEEPESDEIYSDDDAIEGIDEP